MVVRLIGAIAMLSVATLAPAWAQSGKHEDLLKRALAAATRGQCLAALLSAPIKAQCDEQMPGLGEMLTKRGPIEKVEFVGNQATPQGPTEAYRVQYDDTAMMWLISAGADGKAAILWSPGDARDRRR